MEPSPLIGLAVELQIRASVECIKIGAFPPKLKSREGLGGDIKRVSDYYTVDSELRNEL